MKIKLAIIQTHPIQHFCPQFTSYAKLIDIELRVFFETDKGLNSYYDNDFKKQIDWKEIDLSGFQHQFLNGSVITLALEQFVPDAIIIYGYSKPIQKQAYGYALKNKKRILYVSDSENHQKRSVIKEIIKKQYLKFFFSKIDYCLSVGDSNEEVYRNYGVTNDRIIRMFFPINTLFFDQLLQNKNQIKEEIRAKLSIDPNHIIITTIGKLVGWKRQEDLIEVLSLLEKKGIKATGIIIGSGSNETEIIEKSNILKHNRTIITGFVQPEEMAQYLCATDIYIHPAEIEPHSLAISEAIYCGCPVIVSDRCGSYGSTDDVQPGKNGFIYPVGDIEKLAHYIEILAKNKAMHDLFAQTSALLGRHHQSLAHGGAMQAAINLIISA